MVLSKTTTSLAKSVSSFTVYYLLKLSSVRLFGVENF